MTPQPLQALLAVRAQPPADAAWDEAHIAQCLAPGRFRLADGRLAAQALSCLITPEPEDLVLVLPTGAGLFVTHVLQREAAHAQLCAPGMNLLTIAQPGVEVHATNHLALRSGGDLDLESPQGSVRIAARNFVASVTDALVQNAQHLVTHAQHCVLQVAALLRIHGRQTLLTAQDDMKLDAERISLG
jgi:hypothetical protein